MSTRPYELFARFNSQGQVSGVSIRTITTVNGRDYESDPEPLAGTNDPAFIAFAQQFAASAVAQRDSLSTQLQQRDSQLNAAQQTIANLQDQLEAAQARIVELETPPPQPQSITRYQCTQWLRSAGILLPDQQVTDLIQTLVNDPQLQLAAMDRWTLGTSVLRNDPLIVMLGSQLGMTAEQLDAAFTQAATIS